MAFKRSYLFTYICLCFIFVESSLAGISTKNTTEFQHKVQKKPQKFVITQRQISQGANFIGRTLDSILGSLTSKPASSSKNISTSISSSLNNIIPSSLSTSSISTSIGNAAATIPLYIGLPILIIGLAILTKVIAFAIAYIPGATAPIFSKLVDEYGEYLQFDDDKDSSGGYGHDQGHGWQSPSSSYGAPAPQTDSYSNSHSRITYVQSPQEQQQQQSSYSYQKPGPSREQINTASQQLNQAYNKYSQI